LLAEILRVRPPLVDIAREVCEPLIIGDHEMAAGTLVLVPPALVHRHGYEAADTFQPERFLGRRPNPGSWLPFGGGDRRCLGASLALLELRVVLPWIARQFELHPRGDVPSVARLHGTALVPDRRARIILRRR
jgi:cytochrome P450 family 135